MTGESRVTPGDSSGLGAVCREIRRSLEAACRRPTECSTWECVLIMSADYIPISA